MFSEADIVGGIPESTRRLCGGDNLELKRLCCGPVNCVFVERVGEIDDFGLVNWMRSGTRATDKKSKDSH
jgi:hypothetical protein